MAVLASRRTWVPAEHLILLQNRLLAVAAGLVSRLMVFMPPRHGKSMLTSHYFPSWYLGNNPDHRLILAAYEAGFAGTWGQKVRDVMEEWGPAVFGVNVRRDARAASDWLIDGHTGGMKSAGVGTGVTGRGANGIIIDDPIKDAADALSAVKRQAAWDWYLSTLSTRLQPGGWIILMMTRWHQDDLAGRLLRAQKEGHGDTWEVLSLPAIAERADDPLGREPGDPLWPLEWPRYRLDEIQKRQTDYWWRALYQQSPIRPGGTLFRREWWRYYAEDPREIAARADVLFQSWDCTFKEAGTSFVCGQVWAALGSDLYLLDQIRDRFDFTATVDVIRIVSARWPRSTGTILVEETANGPAVISTLAGEYPGIVGIPVRASKESRANAVLLRIRDGNVHLPDPDTAAWVPALVDECADFPSGANDDQVDALTQALSESSKIGAIQLW